MRDAETVLGIIQDRTQRPRKEVTGKPDDIERVTSGLAGGRRERSRKTTSPAAYPTTTPDRTPTTRALYYPRDTNVMESSMREFFSRMLSASFAKPVGARPMVRVSGCGVRVIWRALTDNGSRPSPQQSTTGGTNSPTSASRPLGGGTGREGERPGWRGPGRGVGLKGDKGGQARSQGFLTSQGDAMISERDASVIGPNRDEPVGTFRIREVVVVVVIAGLVVIVVSVAIVATCVAVVGARPAIDSLIPGMDRVAAIAAVLCTTTRRRGPGGSRGGATCSIIIINDP